MTTFLSFLGATGLFLLGASITVFGVVDWFEQRRDRREQRLRNDSYQLAKREVGDQLIGHSWWFSESHETQTAIKMIGEGLTRNRLDVSEIREEWRKEIVSGLV